MATREYFEVLTARAESGELSINFENALSDRWNDAVARAQDEMPRVKETIEFIEMKLLDIRGHDEPAEEVKALIQVLERATKHARFALQGIAEAYGTSIEHAYVQGLLS